MLFLGLGSRPRKGIPAPALQPPLPSPAPSLTSDVLRRSVLCERNFPFDLDSWTGVLRDSPCLDLWTGVLRDHRCFVDFDVNCVDYPDFSNPFLIYDVRERDLDCLLMWYALTARKEDKKGKKKIEEEIERKESIAYALRENENFGISANGIDAAIARNALLRSLSLTSYIRKGLEKSG